MDDKEGAGKNAFKGSSTGLNLKFISSKTEDVSQGESLAIQSSFSYVTDSQKSNKPCKTPGKRSRQNHERHKTLTSLQNEISTTLTKQNKTAEGQSKSDFEKDKQGLAEWSLLGKSLQLFPEYWNPNEMVHRRSVSEPGCNTTESSDRYPFPPGVQTYPPSAARSSSSRERGPSQDCLNLLHTNRHRLPAFMPRPLGQPWVANNERQKYRSTGGGELQRPLDDLLAAGERPPLCAKQSGPPCRYSPTPHVWKTSSRGRHAPRSRSASLPVPGQLHESRVFMEWKERRTGGVTYVTPFLQTLNDESLQSSSQIALNRDQTATKKEYFEGSF